VHRLASSLGFALVGIASAEPTGYKKAFELWLAAGKHGEMAYLQTSFDTRIDPQRLLPGATSIICVADWYGGQEGQVPGTERQGVRSPHSPSALSHPQSPSSPLPHGRIARYAWGDDYHRIIKPRLHQLADDLRAKWPQHDFRSAVDTAPLLEREHAKSAGLGWIGKHTLLIHPQLGSWLLLGAIVTTLPIETSANANYPSPLTPPTDHCGTCTRCIDACPTQCITPYSVDASRCISSLTIEHRSAIDPALHPLMHDWIAGCDVCQEVCPFNQEAMGGRPAEAHAGAAMRPQYQPRPPAPSVPLIELLNWTEADREAALIRSPLKRIKLDMFKRNALIAAGNWIAKHDDPALREKVMAMAMDESESQVVRETARQVARRTQ
jgi:epoxyqueuosine reductase